MHNILDTIPPCKEPRQSGEALSVDNTQISDFLSCPRKWFARHFLGLVPTAKRSAPQFGIAIHAALDAWYKADRDQKVMLDEWSKQDLPTDPIRTRGRGALILAAYHEKYKAYPLKHLHGEMSWNSLPQIEQMNDVLFYGRIDRLVEWSGEIWLMDHKTTSRLGPTYADQFIPCYQPVLYIAAARVLYPKCTGMLIDAIFTGSTAPRPEKKDGSSPQFRRFIVKYPDRVLYSLLDEALIWARRISQTDEMLHTRPDLWHLTCPRAAHPGACTQWGCCDYRDLCRCDFDPRIALGSYKVEPWNPHSQEEEGEA